MSGVKRRGAGDGGKVGGEAVSLSNVNLQA